MVQLIDAITAMHSEIWNTTVALVGLVPSMEQELGRIDNWTKPGCGGRAETEYQEVQ